MESGIITASVATLVDMHVYVRVDAYMYRSLSAALCFWLSIVAVFSVAVFSVAVFSVAYCSVAVFSVAVFSVAYCSVAVFSVAYCSVYYFLTYC